MHTGKTIRRVREAPARPLMIYDGDCGFCREWIALWRRLTGGRVDYATAREAAARFAEIPREEFDRAVQLVEPDGRVSSGAEVAFRSLAAGPGWRFPAWCYDRVPGIARADEAAYRFIARRRGGRCDTR